MKANKPSLLTVKRIDADIVSFLTESGTVFRIFDKQDSGCISYGVLQEGRRLFVKYAEREEAVGFLKQAEAFNNAIAHPLLPKLLNAFQAGNGYALVYEWVSGEVLSTPDFPGQAGRDRPESPHFRFRQLPVGKIVAALTAIYELHADLESGGYIAVDFYDGCMIYDFERDELHLCDFDCYTPGPFILQMDRLYGSSRFMAPEEFVRGSLIDSRTNVFTMGAAAFVFLSDGSRELADWRASEALYRVARKAASPDRADRYESVSAFYNGWLDAWNYIS
ncbi:serine/threonine protein kinase [Paenibacillus piri]|uniref:Serine/threonine protein kinase n=1 Tax=Paenibacillus piri TaxID=2547395 RepID=A0A4R5KW15_9BACL|nr:serine/threonine protein kinase [Paenibacillus piri]TDG00200.1 serine/threonine protein kinase [Paenibacillus piri]